MAWRVMDGSKDEPLIGGIFVRWWATCARSRRPEPRCRRFRKFLDSVSLPPRVGEAVLFRVRPIAAATVLVMALFGGSALRAGAEVSGDVPSKATKELPTQLLSLIQQRNMLKRSPILIRIFKEESELEVWKQDASGRFELLKIYPICRWSGDLGPKVGAGDRQAPEGFYSITPSQMNPNSNYYLAINMGFPNAYDRANDRHGAFLMIHGNCSSSGCYAMTDEQIGEIYALARDSFVGGQPSFQIQAYPFRMTPANMARHRTNPNIAFWTMLKAGSDHFEVTHLEPKVEFCDKRYVFDPQPSDTRSVTFDPAGKCPAFVVNPRIARAVRDKQVADDEQYAQLVKANAPVAPMYSGLDGGMNRVFLAQVGGTLPPARVRPPGSTEQQTDSGATFTSKLLRMFGWNSVPQTQPSSIAMVEEAHPTAGGVMSPPKAKPALLPIKLDSSSADPFTNMPIPVLQITATAATTSQAQQIARTPATNDNTSSIVHAESAGSFSDRWGGLYGTEVGLLFDERWPQR
jgi:murein L,D-transpeptidase YafK